MDLQLRNKVALVTGGSKGIGLGIVQAFLAEGVRVINVNRSVEEGRQLEADAASKGQECFFIAADLAEVSQCQRSVETALQRFGQLDVLVNNAGVNDGVGLEAGPGAFLESLQRNLMHVYAMTHYALPALKQSKGNIINIGSKVAVTGQGGTSGYAASKGGLNALTREWALDLARDGIRVNAVIPAEVWTPLYEKWLKTMPDPQGMRHSIEQMIPFEHRFTTCEEIANTVAFLASNRSSHTTGQILYVDGGYTHFDRKYTG